MPQTVQNPQVLERILHLNFHHVVDKMLVAGALGFTQQQLYLLPVVTDVVHHPMHTLTGLQPHVFRLFLLWQLGKGGLGLHETAHQCSGMGLHNGCKERLFAGEIAVKCAGGDTSLLHNLPQRGTLKAFLREFLYGSPLDFFQRGGRLFFHVSPSI